MSGTHFPLLEIDEFYFLTSVSKIDPVISVVYFNFFYKIIFKILQNEAAFKIN